MNWLIENKEWVFSGVGVFVLGLIITWLARHRGTGSHKQIQKSGGNSKNYQAGGDINIRK
mgnify:CR=1 FL=1